MSGRAVINIATGVPINYLKLVQNQKVNAGGYAYPSILDNNGYPLSTPSSQIAETLELQRDVSGYVGAWVFGWTGKLGGYNINLSNGAGITVTTGGSFVSTSAFNEAFSGTNGRVVFTFNGNDSAITMQWLMTGIYDGTLSGMYLCRADEEASLLAGNFYRQEYIDYLNYLNPYALRFLNPCNINQSNITRFEHMLPAGAHTYTSGRWYPGAWAGTVGGTDTYTCSAAADTPGTWTDGEIIHGYVTNANTITTPTLDCGSRGAKSIVRRDGSALAVGTITAAGLASFMYDALLDKVLLETTNGKDGGRLLAMFPISRMVELGNILQKPIWVQVPLYVDDAYMLALAQYLFANCIYGFILELGNEVWNNSSGFAHTAIASARGAALGFSASNNQRIHGYYGKRFCEMMDIFIGVFGNDTRLKSTIGVQMAGNVSQYNTYRFLGTDLGAYGFDTAPNRPIDKANYINPASYISGAQIRNFDANWNNTMTEALTAADDYDSGVPASMASALAFVDSDIRNGTRNAVAGDETVAAILTKATNWNANAITNGKSVLEYEGALEIAALSTARCTALSISTAYSTKFATLIAAYKNSHYAKKLVMDRFQGAMDLSNYLAPAWYDDIRSSQWALRTGLYATPFKTEEGLSRWNNGYVNLTLGTPV